MKILRKYILPLFILAITFYAFPQGQRDADALVSKARISVNKRNYKAAIPLLNEAKKIYEKLGETIIIEYADNLYLLGVCNAETSPEQAMHYAKSASDLTQRLEGKHNNHYAKAITLLGNCQYQLGEYEEALNSHKEALGIIKVIESDTRKIAKAYELCGDDYFALEDSNNALKFWEAALKISDKFSTAYDRLLDKSISALQTKGKQNKQLKNFLDLKRESDIKNGRIEAPVVTPAVVEPVKKEIKPNEKQKTEVNGVKEMKENKDSIKQEKDKKPKNKRTLRKRKSDKKTHKDIPKEIQYFNY